MRVFLGFFLGLGISSAAFSETSLGVFLADNANNKTHIADLKLTPSGDANTYELHWNDAAFDEYFLSMRPFKCVPTETKLWCRVPYPYEINREISKGDLTDLEYDLLFVWKSSGDYGINMWNGVYYELETKDSGFIGHMSEFDMGRLAVPPPKGEMRPIKSDFLDKADPETHLFPRLVIE